MHMGYGLVELPAMSVHGYKPTVTVTATEAYCCDETDPIALSGVSDFVADYEIEKLVTLRMAALVNTV